MAYLCGVARILAIDYGTKRCGLAVTDPLQMIATPLTTVPTSGLMDYLRDYFAREQVGLIILGDPRRLDNSGSEMTHLANRLANKLQQKFPDIQIERYDERFTSQLAARAMIESGQSRKIKNDKGMLDRVSAAILLQNYLSAKTMNK